MKKFSEFDISALERDLKKEVFGEVRFDLASRALYVSDGSNYRHVPIGVVIPRSTDAVEQTVAICRRYGVPLTSRGCGTSLAGQTCNTAVILDFSKYLNNIIEINPDEKWARVQPGTILDDLRHTAANKYHLTFGPDPATHTHNTLGGMLGNNSCGIHAVMSGRTSDNTIELDVVTFDGLRLRVGETSETELESIIAQGGRRGEIYRKMKELRDRYADLIRNRYPHIPRRISGYNLDELLPENGFNVARALVGSEGTLVTILEARLHLTYSYPGRTLLVLGYPDVFSSGDHIPEIMSLKPIGCEGIDDTLVKFMKIKNLHVKYIHLLPPGGGWLLVEFGGKDKQESDAKALAAMNMLKNTKNPPSMRLYTDKEEENEVWLLRESGLGATANVPGMPLAWEGWEDAAVHPDHVGAYLRDFRSLLNKFGYQTTLYGHLGQGCVHCRITFDFFTHDGIRNYKKFIENAADLVIKYGGSLSGEHGDGQSKAFLLPKMFGEELVGAFREFKAIWDPEWRMNPGKIVDPYPADQDLRLGVDYRPWQPETSFKFPEDHGSFSRATLRCVGVGECRRPSDAFMCPSFLATREEMDTTRGRAHMLFEVFRGDLLKDKWNSEEVMRALEFCLGCKGCKHECPVNVDIATYKAEYHYNYYKHHLRPRAAYVMGLIGYWNSIASKIPHIANFINSAPLLNNVMKEFAGIDSRRPMPKFAIRTFSSWYAKREPKNLSGPRLVLYPDYLNDYIFPWSLAAAADIFERWGFNVIVPDAKLPALRPLIHYGMLDLTKKELLNCLDILRPYYREGVPVIHLEPSELSVYRDELKEIFPNDRDAQRIEKLSFLVSEFVTDRDLELPKLEGEAILHGHCHQKSVLNFEAAQEVLKKMGISYEMPQPGCCGMSGSFGFEKKSYDMSIKISREHLIPAVKEAKPFVHIVADGFSCREQIIDGTGREPLHMAQLIQKAFLKRDKEKRDIKKPFREGAPMPPVEIGLGAAGAAVALGLLVVGIGKLLKNK
ncbi:MAG: FAD-linked oxidase C-terminal domain-containing protein [Smithella sp.]